MIIWIDAQLSPSIAAWINRSFQNIQAQSVRSLDLQRADDNAIFDAAKKAAAVIMSKDSDFLKLVDQFGTPPQIIWITCGNTSNSRMRAVLAKSLGKAVELINSGEPVVEIGDKI
jgi:predicted nuclease of predicted toxin-antitoxin system